MPSNKLWKADSELKKLIREIQHKGVDSEQPRPKYADGSQAFSRYLNGYFVSYDLSKGEFPITTLRPIPWKSAIKEMLWIYKDQTNDLSVLRDKYGVNYWDEWDIGDGTIGKRYGYIVRKHNIIDRIREQLKENPWNRRNIISLWDYEEFDSSDGLLPCAFQFMFDVRRFGDDIYLDGTLVQRSNDLLVAHHINAIQYVALQMIIANEFGFKVGNFNYFVNNIHIYNNQWDNANTLLFRPYNNQSPKLVLNAPVGTSIYDIKPEDFEMVDYRPTKPQLKFELAI